MRTDKERFKELFDDCDIPYKKEKDPYKYLKCDAIVLEESGTIDKGVANANVIGYGGFHAVICFDNDGKFLHVGLWE